MSKPSTSQIQNSKFENTRPLTNVELERLVEEFSDSEKENFQFSDSDDENSESSFSDHSSSASDDDDEDEAKIEDDDGEEIDEDLADITITPTSQWFEVSGENQQQFNFNERGIVTADIQSQSSPIECYTQFITNDILDLIVTETNRNAQQVLNKNRYTRTSRFSRWTPTNILEMRRFFCLLIWMGLVRYPSIEKYWSKNRKYKNNVAPFLMSRNRFELLLRFWHFSNNEISPAEDRIFKIRGLVETMLVQYKHIMKPDIHLAVDETMVPFRGRLRFKQYIPGKRHKYGIKLFKLCGTNGYTYSLIVYQGKMNRGQHDLATHVVLDLCKDYLDTGRILVTDNFYTNIPLAGELLRRKTHSVGTLRKNRKGLPKEIVNSKLKRGEIVGKENKEGIVVAKWRDKRDVLILSTKHTLEIVQTGKKNRAGEEINKPKIVVDYNSGKAGIDLSDQLSSYSTPMRKSIRWYHKVACEILFGTTVVNAYVLYKTLNPQMKISITSFRESLVDSFLHEIDQIIPNIVISDESSVVRPILEDQNRLKPKHKLEQTTEKCNRNRKIRKRCLRCYDKHTTKDGSKVAAKLTRKVTTFCSGCEGNPFMCLSCFNSHIRK